jgi:hypothetical protein
MRYFGVKEHLSVDHGSELVQKLRHSGYPLAHTHQNHEVLLRFCLLQLGRVLKKNFKPLGHGAKYGKYVAAKLTQQVFAGFGSDA